MDTEELRKLLDKATPGPWLIGEEQCVDECWSIVTTSGGAIIANVNDNAKRRANALLIAMAPTLARKVIAAEKLVEALRQSQSQIEYLHARLGENTGSGNAVYVRNAAALAAWEAAQ